MRGEPVTNKNSDARKKHDGSGLLSNLWIILIVIVVLAAVGYVVSRYLKGRG